MVGLSYFDNRNLVLTFDSPLSTEKVMYYSQMQRVAKAPGATRRVLRCLKHPGAGRNPLLPLPEEDPRKSPLHALAHEDLTYSGQSEGERASQLTAEWMGPGPWPLRFNVEILDTCGSLRPTSMNKKGNITVSHVLMVIIRVEKGDSGETEADGKKKKMYDIIIQYPIHLLSVSISFTWRAVVVGVDGDSAVSM
jgi:hypothetical protein